MTAIAAAIDALFADPNFGKDGVWMAGGDPPGVSVRAIVKRPDEVAGFGGARLAMAGVVIDVRASQATPSSGDRFMIGSSVFEVIADPMADPLSLIWSCECREV